MRKRKKNLRVLAGKLQKTLLPKTFSRFSNIDLNAAVRKGDAEAVRNVLQRMSKNGHPEWINKRDKSGRTALSLAILTKREDIALLILEYPEIDVEKTDESRLIDLVLGPESGVDEGKEESIELLRGKKRKMTLFNQAARLGLCRVALKMLKRKGSADSYSLGLACLNGHEAMVRILLNAHADPEDCDEFGWNALFYSVYGGHQSLAQMILDDGVDKNARDKDGLKAVDWAIFLHHENIVSLLENYVFRPCLML